MRISESSGKVVKYVETSNSLNELIIEFEDGSYLTIRAEHDHYPMDAYLEIDYHEAERY